MTSFFKHISTIIVALYKSLNRATLTRKSKSIFICISILIVVPIFQHGYLDLSKVNQIILSQSIFLTLTSFLVIYFCLSVAKLHVLCLICEKNYNLVTKIAVVSSTNAANLLLPSGFGGDFSRIILSKYIPNLENFVIPFSHDLVIKISSFLCITAVIWPIYLFNLTRPFEVATLTLLVFASSFIFSHFVIFTLNMMNRRQAPGKPSQNNGVLQFYGGKQKILLIYIATFLSHSAILSVLMCLWLCTTIFLNVDISFIEISLGTLSAVWSTLIAITPGGLGIGEIVFANISKYSVEGAEPLLLSSIYFAVRIFSLLFSIALASCCFISQFLKSNT